SDPSTVIIAVTGDDNTNVTGVPSTVEDGAPNNGDGNSDGIPDRIEPYVASLPSYVNGSFGPYVTFESGGRSNPLLDVGAVFNPSPSDTPACASFPFGFFNYQVIGVSDGGAVTVEMTLASPLSGSTSDWTFWRYGRTPKNATDHWYQFLYQTQTDSDDAS